VDQRLVRALADLPERGGEEALRRYAASVDSSVRSRQGFMMGIIKRVHEEERMGRAAPAGYGQDRGAPPPYGGGAPGGYPGGGGGGYGGGG
jgi:hypothetical protein